MDANLEDNTSYTTQYQQAFLMQVEIEYYAKHRGVLVIKLESIASNNHFPSSIASGSGQSACHSYNVCSNAEEY
jgi:hypothetical protein